MLRKHLDFWDVTKRFVASFNSDIVNGLQSLIDLSDDVINLKNQQWTSVILSLKFVEIYL